MKLIISIYLLSVSLLFADTVGIEKSWNSVPYSESMQEYAQNDALLLSSSEQQEAVKEWVTPIEQTDTYTDAIVDDTPTQTTQESIPMATILPAEPTPKEVVVTPPVTHTSTKIATTTPSVTTLQQITTFFKPLLDFFNHYPAQFFTLVGIVFALFFLLFYLPLKLRVRREEDEEISIYPQSNSFV